ncbi:MAG TPA: ATP synthase F1 subunit epsilon [Stellaceae bacterium]|jgi:F-type H+-transporting ATPase subunit epsilon|nr:ATP synthase F1 subunit epsilon [Stellaceae bacterium]
MAATLQFELVSPERLLRSEAVEMVVVPGTEGNFGVLPGHALLISTVRPGLIEIYEAGKVKDRIFVAGGFAEVNAERCTVLADEAVALPDLNRAVLEGEARELEARLAATQNEEERNFCRRQIAVVDAKLTALGAATAH